MGGKQRDLKRVQGEEVCPSRLPLADGARAWGARSAAGGRSHSARLHARLPSVPGAVSCGRRRLCPSRSHLQGRFAPRRHRRTEWPPRPLGAAAASRLPFLTPREASRMNRLPPWDQGSSLSDRAGARARQARLSSRVWNSRGYHETSQSLHRMRLMQYFRNRSECIDSTMKKMSKV